MCFARGAWKHHGEVEVRSRSDRVRLRLRRRARHRLERAPLEAAERYVDRLACDLDETFRVTHLRVLEQRISFARREATRGARRARPWRGIQEERATGGPRYRKRAAIAQRFGGLEINRPSR